MSCLAMGKEGQFEEKRGHLSTSSWSLKLTRKKCKDSGIASLRGFFQDIEGTTLNMPMQEAGQSRML